MAHEPAQSRAHSVWLWGPVLAALLLLGVLASLVIARPGYSPDEEITAVLSQAIGSRGAPVLPSGILYHLGLPYLYLAWLAGSLLGPTMFAWRLASLCCAAAGIVFAFALSRRVRGPVMGISLALGLAAFPPYVMAAVFARQYGALLATTLLFLWLFAIWTSDRRRRWPALAALACAALLHPIGAALAALPIAYAAMDDPDSRGSSVRFAVVAATVTALTMAAAYGAHMVSVWAADLSVSGDTAIYAVPPVSLPYSPLARLSGFRSWAAAIGTFAAASYLFDRLWPRHRGTLAVAALCGVTFQLGLLVFIAVIWTLVRPPSARRIACFIPFGMISVAFWTIHTAMVTDAQLNIPLARGLTKSALVYPLDVIQFALGPFPALCLLAVVACVAASIRRTRADRLVRSMAVVALCILAALDVVSVSPSERYLLLPWILVWGVSAVGLAEIAGLATRGTVVARMVACATALAAASWLLADNYRWGVHRDAEVGPVAGALRFFAPVTGSDWTPEGLRVYLRPTEKLVCNEELACVYLLGRVDYLIALPPRDAAHYAVSRDGAARGFYAGAPVVSSGAEFEHLVRQQHDCVLFVAVSTGKVGFDEYKALVAATSTGSEILLSTSNTYVSRVCADPSGHGG